MATATKENKKVDATDLAILELIKDTRLQQVLILKLEGKTADEISKEVGSTVAKNALALLGTGRGKLNQCDPQAVVNAIESLIKEGKSINLAKAVVADEFGVQLSTIERHYKNSQKDTK